jgi:hypothetical protein
MQDIATALAHLGSRKQLRRVAAQVGLQAEEPGSLRALISLDSDVVAAAIREAIPEQENQSQLVAHLRQLAVEGVPLEHGAASVAVAGGTSMAATPAAAAPPPHEGCVECHLRTPFVFELLGCRLCERCERAHQPKYGLVAAITADQLYCVPERELSRLRFVGGKREPRLYLRTDIEECATRVDGVARSKSAAAAEWREKSFRPDARGDGKTHKWKEWNQSTFQMQRARSKQQLTAPDADGASSVCNVHSGLVHVGLEQVPVT